ncbi:NAD-dependent epimerase/dehydratase family protein [Micromonospora sp. WMMD1120]|uniref:NAD-dependent epimerase/dehydratase family protein n=1 Tax=Micromonospora sp. WMMD1120 TaxID=3016106 RepID=UPI002417B955|nr:NAD-dependent epimerase/dehydratase family protein [Micromonospora sp. WMMD1120]MDG4807194.1 NAD-dependent epimerase/dehydratase family protein [Micromonospora sp. WMMD1120]
MPGSNPQPVALVTGASGFLGGMLAAKLRSRDWVVVGIDRVPQPRLGVVTADIRDVATLGRALPRHIDIVIHMASLLSAFCEKNPAEAFDVNVAGTAKLLEVLADRGQPALLMASSIAVFNGVRATDDTPVRPSSAYGTSKVMAELLIADATRRGIVRGHAARLPTVAVRPGPPSGAASAFASTMVKNAFDGTDISVPVPAGQQIVLTSPTAAVENLYRLAETLVRERAIVPNTINVPGIAVDVDDIAQQCRAAAPATVRIRREIDPEVAAVVTSWPAGWDCPSAVRLGLQQDTSFADILADYRLRG